MALIKCPNCDKDVSDKAKSCPACGHVLIEEPVTEEKAPEIHVCEECGAQLPADATSCPSCGCPVPVSIQKGEEAPQKVEVTAVNLPKMQKKTKAAVGIIITAALLFAVAAFLFIGLSKQNAAAEYAENLDNATYMMLNGAVQAEDAGNLIKSVWYNSIHEERDSETDKYTRMNYGTGSFYDDFNDALGNLFADADFRSTLSSIESNQDSVASIMKDLKNPPEEFEDAYDAIREYYDAYLALTNLAIDPSGSLTTFSSNFNDADTEVVNCYNAMKLYLD